MIVDAPNVLPWLSEEAQRWHATMVLGGWTFRYQYGVYSAINPQGRNVRKSYTLFTAVDAAWNRYGGNGNDRHC
jgi:hypothetical protein